MHYGSIIMQSRIPGDSSATDCFQKSILFEFPQFYSAAPKAPATLCGRGILHRNCFWKTSFPRAILCNLTQLLLQRVLLTHCKCRIRKLKLCSLSPFYYFLFTYSKNSFVLDQYWIPQFSKFHSSI